MGAQKLVKNDAQRPHVNLATIRPAAVHHSFRRRVNERATTRHMPASITIGGSHAEVGQLDFEATVVCDVHKEVFHFDIAMHNVVGVAVLDGCEHLVKYFLD